MTSYAHPTSQPRTWHTLTNSGLGTLCGLRVDPTWEWGVPGSNGKCLRCLRVRLRLEREEGSHPSGEYVLTDKDRDLIQLALSVSLQFTEEEVIASISLNRLHSLLQMHVHLCLLVLAEHAAVSNGLSSDATARNAHDAKTLLGKIGVDLEWLKMLNPAPDGSTSHR